MRALGFGILCAGVVFSFGCGKDTPEVVHLDPATWCDHVSAGPSGTQALALDFSAANAAIRTFGGEQGNESADVALADALTPADALSDAGIATALSTYDKELLEVCALPADDDPLPAASVEMQGPVAVVHPGTGTVSLPSGATAVAVDLRNLPNAPGVKTAVENAVALGLTANVPRPTYVTLAYIGAPDELSVGNSLFKTAFGPGSLPDIPGKATQSLPMALITGPRLPPSAALIAFQLRRKQKAWIFGEDVRAASAESCWQGIGDEGLAYRCRELGENDARWPDRVPADRPTSEIQAALASLPGLRAPDAVTPQAGDRPLLQTHLGDNRQEPTSFRLGDARAALLISHGGVKLFSLFAQAHASDVDARLLETLSSLGQPDAPDRTTVVDLLNRFSQALQDGQATGGDLTAAPIASELPLILDVADGGTPAVRASGDSAVLPGDEIVAVGATDIATWLSDQEQTLSASTPGDAVQRALWRLLYTTSDVTLTLKNTAGNTRDVTVSPVSLQTVQALRANEERASGYVLSDFGAPNDFYLNLDGSQLSDMATLNALIQQAQGAAGMVVDLRGTLVLDPLAVASALMSSAFSGATFETPLLAGFESDSVGTRTAQGSPGSPTYDGNLVIIVGPGTIDLAEQLGTVLVDTGRAGHVIGRTSAGTAGTPTGFLLPGQLGFRFTGEAMLHADGGTFEGVGVVPDVPSAPAQIDLADGTDRELVDAVTALDGM